MMEIHWAIYLWVNIVNVLIGIGLGIGFEHMRSSK